MLTRQQSEAVCDYLKAKHSIQKLGWFSSRKVTPVGLGVEPPPLPEPDALPPDRVEIQVFTPSSSREHEQRPHHPALSLLPAAAAAGEVAGRGL